MAESSIRSSEQVGCTIDRIVLRDCLIEDVSWSGLFQMFAVGFVRVTLAGKLGRLMISDSIGLLGRERLQAAFDAANAELHAGAGWALDISRAELKEFDLRGVPARLVRRDPETQLVVTAERARAMDWRSVDMAGSYWHAYIDGMLTRGASDVVLAAPRASRKLKTHLAALQRLRDAGIAMP